MKTNPCCLPSDYQTTNIFSCLSCDFQSLIICLFRYLLPLDFSHVSAISSRTNPLKVKIILITLNLSPSGCWLRWPVSPILAGIETCHFTVCPGPVPESLRGGNTFYILKSSEYCFQTCALQVQLPHIAGRDTHFFSGEILR